MHLKTQDKRADPEMFVREGGGGGSHKNQTSTVYSMENWETKIKSMI